MKTNDTNNIKTTLLAFLMCLYFQHSSAQQYEKFWQNVRFGGNIGMSFGNGSFSGILAPSAIYDFNPKMSAGLGIHFGYSNFRNFEASNYGASVIGLYNPFPEIQFSAEFEQMGVNRTFKISGEENTTETYWYPALFLGAGYSFGPVTVGLRYDVLYDRQKSIYASAYAPFFRIFF